MKKLVNKKKYARIVTHILTWAAACFNDQIRLITKQKNMTLNIIVENVKHQSYRLGFTVQDKLSIFTIWKPFIIFILLFLAAFIFYYKCIIIADDDNLIFVV